MKKYLKFMAYAMIAIFGLTFVSCSSDDDDSSNIDKSKLVGKWINTRIDWIDKREAEPWSCTYNDDNRYLILNSDGTGSVLPYNLFENEIRGTFQWNISGNKLTMFESDGDKDVYIVSSLTNNELVLRWEDGPNTEISTFKKAVDTEY